MYPFRCPQQATVFYVLALPRSHQKGRWWHAIQKAATPYLVRPLNAECSFVLLSITLAHLGMQATSRLPKQESHHANAAFIIFRYSSRPQKESRPGRRLLHYFSAFVEGALLRKNSQKRQMSFTLCSLSISHLNSKSRFEVTLWVGRSQAAKWQSAGHGSPGTL